VEVWLCLFRPSCYKCQSIGRSEQGRHGGQNPTASVLFRYKSVETVNILFLSFSCIAKVQTPNPEHQKGSHLSWVDLDCQVITLDSHSVVFCVLRYSPSMNDGYRA